MTFNSVISTLRAGRAAYVPVMRGYLCRTDEVFAEEDKDLVNAAYDDSWTSERIGAWETARAKYGIPVSKTGGTYDEPAGISAIAHFTFVENANVDPYGNAPDQGTQYVFTKYTYMDGGVKWFAPNLRSGTAPTDAGKSGVALPLVLDAQLFAAIASSDWEIVDTSVAETRKRDLNAVTRW